MGTNANAASGGTNGSLPPPYVPGNVLPHGGVQAPPMFNGAPPGGLPPQPNAGALAPLSPTPIAPGHLIQPGQRGGAPILPMRNGMRSGDPNVARIIAGLKGMSGAGPLNGAGTASSGAQNPWAGRGNWWNPPTQAGGG